MAKKKARALVDFSDGERSYRCDDLVEAEEKIIAALADAGQVDPHPDAVAYISKAKKAEAQPAD